MEDHKLWFYLFLHLYNVTSPIHHNIRNIIDWGPLTTVNEPALLMVPVFPKSERLPLSSVAVSSGLLSTSIIHCNLSVTILYLEVKLLLAS